MKSSKSFLLCLVGFLSLYSVAVSLSLNRQSTLTKPDKQQEIQALKTKVRGEMAKSEQELQASRIHALKTKVQREIAKSEKQLEASKQKRGGRSDEFQKKMQEMRAKDEERQDKLRRMREQLEASKREAAKYLGEKKGKGRGKKS